MAPGVAAVVAEVRNESVEYHLKKRFNIKLKRQIMFIGIAFSRQLCRKTAALSCHRCLINICVEKMDNI